MESNGLPETLNLASYLGASDRGMRVECSSPDVTKYHDPATQQFKTTGGTLLQATARNGMRGTIIPRASFGGASLGVDHEHVGTIVIDPGENGDGLKVDLALLTKDMSERTYAATKSAVANISGLTPIERTRLGSAAFFHTVARETQVQPVTTIPVVQKQQARPEPESAPLRSVAPSPPVQAPPRTLRNLSNFAVNAPAPEVPETLQAPIREADGTTTVAFGIGGEDIPASFTTVIRVPGAVPTQGALILGVMAGTRGFFPKSGKQVVAVVVGERTAMTLEPTGIMFRHNGEDLVVYLVIGERDLGDHGY